MTPCFNTKRAQFYRKDYIYVEKYDAFYKLQWNVNGLSWSSAFLNCDDEGAKLFYPKDNDEWTVAQSLAQNMMEQPNVTDVFVGLHDEFQLGEFITVDGKYFAENTARYIISPFSPRTITITSYHKKTNEHGNNKWL